MNSKTEKLQHNNYYPFGLKHKGYNAVVSSNVNAVAKKFKYNGKELNDELGLDLYDYGARFYDAALGRFHTQDAFAEEYLDFTPYQYGVNNPVSYVDINGDSIQATTDAILAIYHALDKNANVHFDVKNGMIDSESFKAQAEDSDDIVLKDLYEIASNEQTVEMKVSDNYDYKDNDGNDKNSDDNKFMKFLTPFDDNTNLFPRDEAFLKSQGKPTGKFISGNLGRTLVPGSNNPTGANSPNGNIQIIINAKGNINHRAVAVAHEFGHVVLYLRNGGVNFRHEDKGVNGEINTRTTIVSKRLGYDF